MERGIGECRVRTTPARTASVGINTMLNYACLHYEPAPAEPGLLWAGDDKGTSPASHLAEENPESDDDLDAPPLIALTKLHALANWLHISGARVASTGNRQRSIGKW
jgi:hypothetical protein